MRPRRTAWMRGGWRMRSGATASSAFTIRRSRFASYASCAAAGTRWCSCGHGCCSGSAHCCCGTVSWKPGVSSRRDAVLDKLVLPPRAAATAAIAPDAGGRARGNGGRRGDVRSRAATDPIASVCSRSPAWGRCSALLIRAEIGEMRRFPTPGHLASYAGLVPRVDASAGPVSIRAHYPTGIAWLRWALVEAAMHGPQR